MTPGTPADLAGLLRSAIRDGEPVVLLEHRKVYETEGPVPVDPDFMVPVGRADIARHGEDATVVAWGWMRHVALEAAAELGSEDVQIEVIDPRTIAPMDWPTIVSSASRTGRLVVVEEGPITGSVAAEVVARVAESTGGDVTVSRVTMPDAIHPYSPEMEARILPTAEWVAKAVRTLLATRR